MSSPRCRAWRLLASCLAGVLAACSGGGSSSGDGATFARAVGGDDAAAAVSLLPLSDGYLLLGHSADALMLGRLDGNGDLASDLTTPALRGDDGMRSASDAGVAQVAISPAEGGWIRTAFDHSVAANRLRLVVSRYRAAATPDQPPTLLWRNEQVRDFDTTLWGGASAQLADNTRLLGVRAQTAAGSWHGVLALVATSAYVDAPTTSGVQRQLRSRYQVWRFTAGGSLQSVTELDEWLGGARFQGYTPVSTSWSLGADGAYLVELRGSAIEPVARYWRTAVDSRPPAAVPTRATPGAAALMGGDLLWVDGSELRRMRTNGATEAVANLAASVAAGESLGADTRVVCLSNSRCQVLAQSTDRLQLVWDQDGQLLARMSLATDLPAPDYSLVDAAATAEGDLLLLLRWQAGFALTRLAGDLSRRTTTDLRRYTSSFSAHLLADSGLAVHQAGTLPPELMPVISLYDPGLATLYDVAAAQAAQARSAVGLREAVSLGGDDALALLSDDSVVRLRRGAPVERVPAPRLAGDDSTPVQAVRAFSDGQGYLLLHTDTGWSAHDLDGSLRWSAHLRGANAQTVRPLDGLPLDGGDTVLVGMLQGASTSQLVLARLDGNGQARWRRVYAIHANTTVRAVALPDGALLVALFRGDESKIQLARIDGGDGSVQLRRDLRPASGGYRPRLLPGYALVTAADGRAWLGMSSTQLVWQETAVAGSDQRVPVAYGGRNLALVRLDAQLRPDRLRVYGAAGDETLNGLAAAPGGGLLVAAATDAIGLGAALQDAWVMRVDADGGIGEGCQALLLGLDDSLARDYLGTTGPLTLDTVPGAETALSQADIGSAVSGTAAAYANPLSVVPVEAARMCLAGLGPVQPPEPPPPPPPPAGGFTLTVVIDGGPGAAQVRTGEQPMPQLDCLIDYQATTTCRTTYAAGTDVALYGEAFAALAMDWEGCTRGLDDLERPVCRLTMDQDRTVNVHLRPTHLLSVTIAGQPIRGTVVQASGSTTYVYCVSPDTGGATCDAEVPEGESVLLSWNDAGGYGVQSWEGCTPGLDANNRPVCRLVMDTDHAVTATFGP